MKSTLESLEGNKVKLSVEVEPAEFDRDIDAAFRKIAREVKLPGFRNGKAPRRVLEARIGVAPAREQALRDAIPQYLAQAVREHDVDLVATPDVEITGGAEEGPVAFDATCEVRPEITVPGYGGLRIELPSPVATDDEIDEAVEGERKRHGTLVDVDRPAASGDNVVLDLEGTRDGEPVAGLTADEWSYEVGRGWVAPGFDDELIGASAGDSLTFTLTPNGTEDPADFQVTVNRVQEVQLPELTDEWVAATVEGADTVEAWRAMLAERIGAMKLNQARSVFVDRTTAALAELVEIDAPESMVNGDLQARVQNTVQRFQQQGISLEQWLAATGQDTDAFVDGLREQSRLAVKVDLALRAVAAAEGMEVTDDDLDAELQGIAARVGQKPANVRRAYERSDALGDLVAQIRKSRALDWLLHNVEIVDPDGQPIDRDLVLGHTHDEHGGHHHHDHDHDHHDHDHHDHDHDHHDHVEGERATQEEPA